MLEELDGSHLAGTFAGDRLKKFHPRQRLHLDHTPDLDVAELPNLDDFLYSKGDSDLFHIPDDILAKPLTFPLFFLAISQNARI